MFLSLQSATTSIDIDSLAIYSEELESENSATWLRFLKSKNSSKSLLREWQVQVGAI